MILKLCYFDASFQSRIVNLKQVNFHHVDEENKDYVINFHLEESRVLSSVIHDVMQREHFIVWMDMIKEIKSSDNNID